MLRMDRTLALSGLRVAIFRFAPRAPLRLQPYAGSVWRGAFGHALKRIVCTRSLAPCAGCPLQAACLYPSFFGAEAETDVTRPYILTPDPTPRGGWVGPGESFDITLTLLPAAERAAAYAARALVEAASAGLTARRVPLDLLSLRPAHAPEVGGGGPLEPLTLASPPAPNRVRLRFVTPLRLRLQADLLTGRTLRPAHLVAAAIRRLRLLGLAAPDELATEARRAVNGLEFADPRLGWLETTRFSTRQNTSMQLGGIVGQATLEFTGAPEIWPFLWAASVLHLGKSAAMGFGKVVADAA